MLEEKYWYQPLEIVNLPGEKRRLIDCGDPNVLTPPSEEGQFKHYVVVTGNHPDRHGRFAIFGTNDFTQLEFLDNALKCPEDDRWRWAPCLFYAKLLKRPYIMIYSVASGWGNEENDNLGHKGHHLVVATSRRPEGPYVDSGVNLTPGREFAIDPDVFEENGKLMLACAIDYLDNEPVGTGLGIATISPDFRHLLTPIEPLARPSCDWHCYQRNRDVRWKRGKALAGIDWEHGQGVDWYCIEGPCHYNFLPNRRGYLYAGGNYTSCYAVGALVQTNEGQLFDTATTGHKVLQEDASRQLFMPGHGDIVVHDSQPYLVFHARTTREAKRDIRVAPLLFNEKNWPYCPQ